jgi:cytochrome c oxidase subunit 2
MTSRAVVLALLFLLAACRAEQSVLAPQGRGAADIASLAWLLFTLAGIILAAVCAALWIALRGPERPRSFLASAHAIEICGVALPVVILSALLVYGLLTRTPGQASQGSPTLRIEIVGEQWWWRVDYVGEDGTRIASANEINMPVGRDVEFVLTSADVIHSFWVPSLGGKVDMVPGRVNRLVLKAIRPGIYRGQCAEYCGGAHAWMSMNVVALEAVAFDDWLRAQTDPSEEPETDDTQGGRAIFISAGCGACHTIRGTVTVGAVGPDLTHVGTRRSVGIDTMPMTAENIARFIVDNQHIKPGNRMPPFRIFTAEELSTLSSYLVGLR